MSLRPSLLVLSLALTLFMGGLLVQPQIAHALYDPNYCANNPGEPGCLPQKWEGITLLQPLGDTRTINVSSGIGTFINYFNDATSWLLTVVVGICVLWVLIGGFQIMLSGGFSGMDSAGKNHMIWAIAGLAITLFAGFILRLLNSMFFT